MKPTEVDLEVENREPGKRIKQLEHENEHRPVAIHDVNGNPPVLTGAHPDPMVLAYRRQEPVFPRLGKFVAVAQYELIEQSALEELARWLDSLTWPLKRDACVDRATSRGWTVIDEEDGKGDIFDTGLLTKRSWAMSNVANGEVYQLSVFTSPVVAGVLPSDEEFVAHAFSRQVQVASTVLGGPAAEEAGVDGSATWLLASGAALRVGRTDRSCAWKIDSPDFTQLKRDVREIEAEDQDENARLG